LSRVSQALFCCLKTIHEIKGAQEFHKGLT
jgi:hypothetical protein